MNEFYTPEESAVILSWMQMYCSGVLNSRHYEYLTDRPLRDRWGQVGYIAPFMPGHIDKQKWMAIMDDLIRKGHIFHSISFGYFFMPLLRPSAADLAAGKQALMERKEKLSSEIAEVNKALMELSSRGQGQKDIFYN